MLHISHQILALDLPTLNDLYNFLAIFLLLFLCMTKPALLNFLMIHKKYVQIQKRTKSINFLMNQNMYSKRNQKFRFQSHTNFFILQTNDNGQDCRIEQLFFKSGFLILHFASKCLNESKKNFFCLTLDFHIPWHQNSQNQLKMTVRHQTNLFSPPQI